MPSSQGYRKVASEPVDPEPVGSYVGQDTPKDSSTMPGQKTMEQPAVVTGNPAGKLPATNSQQRLMPADSDSVSSSLDEADLEAPPGGGGGGLRQIYADDDRSVSVSSTSTGRQSRTAWFTVIVLCFVNLINYMDRFTIAGRSGLRGI